MLTKAEFLLVAAAAVVAVDGEETNAALGETVFRVESDGLITAIEAALKAFLPQVESEAYQDVREDVVHGFANVFLLGGIVGREIERRVREEDGNG